MSGARSLYRRASRCVRCPRMSARSAVLGAECGSLPAPVLFVGEAPGRLGADRSRVPFRGDRSGQHFDELLAHVGLTRAEVFITNAVLCCPVTDGRNARPSAREIANCCEYLTQTIDLVSPVVVAALGAVALDAVARLAGCRWRLGEVVGRRLAWGDRIVVPLYHPSPRVTNYRRPLARQKRDIEAVAAALRERGYEAASRSA